MFMFFQKKSLTPEDMEKTAGGFFSNRTPIALNRNTNRLSRANYDYRRVAPVVDDENGHVISQFKYIVYDDITKDPVALTWHVSAAEELDKVWNKASEEGGKDIVGRVKEHFEQLPLHLGASGRDYNYYLNETEKKELATWPLQY